MKLLTRKLGEDWEVAIPELTKQEALLTMMQKCGYYAEMELENEIRSSMRDVNGETFEYKVVEIKKDIAAIKERSSL